MLVVGSKALKFNFPESERSINDIDIIALDEDIKKLIEYLQPKSIKTNEYITTLFGIKNDEFFTTKNVELLNATNSTSLKMYLEYDKDRPTLENGIKYASKEVIFSLKKSHIHFPIKFDKHIKDYTFLYEKMNGVDVLKHITKINFKETEERLGKLKTPSLKKATDNFFGQSEKYVTYFFIHDDIHKVMAHYDRPLYEKMQKDSTSAFCVKDMWLDFTFEEKCKCVLEEAYVIALERKVIPSIFGGKDWVSHKEALDWSLMRICTTLCSGCFREFATDNFFKIKEYINPDYVNKFLLAFESGLINKMK